MSDSQERYLTLEDVEYLRNHAETDDPIAKLILMKPKIRENLD